MGGCLSKEAQGEDVAVWGRFEEWRTSSERHMDLERVLIEFRRSTQRENDVTVPQPISRVGRAIPEARYRVNRDTSSSSSGDLDGAVGGRSEEGRASSERHMDLERVLIEFRRSTQRENDVTVPQPISRVGRAIPEARYRVNRDTSSSSSGDLDGAVGGRSEEGRASSDGAVGGRSEEGRASSDGAVGGRSGEGRASSDGAVGGRSEEGQASSDGAVGGRSEEGQASSEGPKKDYAMERHMDFERVQRELRQSTPRENDVTVPQPISRVGRAILKATYRVNRDTSSSSSGDLEGATSGGVEQTLIPQQKSNALLVAAIDFGTTYSGYAYSFLTKPDEILTNYWDCKSIKIPTVVLMDPRRKFHSFGNEARTKYEQLFTTEQHKKWYFFERFKMKLFVKETPLLKDMEIEDILGKSMKAIEVFSAAIKYIREHLMAVLNDPNRERYVQIEEKDIHWILTVPAIWNDLSKKFMRDAATAAGISGDMLSLALEPEAASLFCCKRELGVTNIPVGCKYMVLDLGGGTADITCHNVNGDGTLMELWPPTGGDFGGTTVDYKFLSILIGIFGRPIINDFRTNFMSEYWDLMTDFELKKRKFDGTGRVVFKFPIRLLELHKKDAGETVEDTVMNYPMSGKIEFKHGLIFITEALMKEIFNSAMTDIVNAVNEVIGNVGSIDNIILVGGFSESPYIQKVMCENFGNRVVFPNEPSGAVLNGAVIYGHETKAISSRKCRFTYGIARMIRFIPESHPEKKKVQMDKFTYCDDAFCKHIELGTEVSVNTPEKAEAHEYFPSMADMRQAVLEVYKSKMRNPVYIDEDGCEFVGLVRVDIDPQGDIKSKLMVRLIFGGTELIVEITDVKNGKITKGAVDFRG